MHLAPTADQQAIKDAVRRFCQEQVTPERLAAWEKEPTGVDGACWRAVVDLGWLGLGVPAAAGLAAMVRGEQTVALAFDEQNTRDPAKYGTHIVSDGAGPRLVGEKWCV